VCRGHPRPWLRRHRHGRCSRASPSEPAGLVVYDNTGRRCTHTPNGNLPPQDGEATASQLPTARRARADWGPESTWQVGAARRTCAGIRAGLCAHPGLRRGRRHSRKAAFGPAKYGMRQAFRHPLASAPMYGHIGAQDEVAALGGAGIRRFNGVGVRKDDAGSGECRQLAALGQTGGQSRHGKSAPQGGRALGYGPGSVRIPDLGGGADTPEKPPSGLRSMG
jgi:hypothetical protein